MEDLVKELGLTYADSLPVAIGSCVAILFGLGWLFVKTDLLEESFKTPARVFLVAVALVVVLQYPAAYQSAKDDCRQKWVDAGGTSFSYDPPVEYAMTDCVSVWPHGPDGLPGPGPIH